MTPFEPADFPRDEFATKLAEATVQVVFGYRNDPTHWDFQRLPLHGTLQEAFRSRAEAQAIVLRDDMFGRAYDPQWQLEENEFFYLSNEPPIGGNFFPQLAQFADLPDYKERRRARQPNAWIVIAQFNDDTLAFLGARITAKSVLGQDSRVLRVVYSRDAFDTLNSTVITFGSFDWVAWQEAILVLDATDFHATFRDIPALIAQVESHLEILSQHIEIENLDAFRTRIERYPAMMVKLQGIIDRADMHTRPPDVLRQYAEDYSIAVDWNEDKLIFDGTIERQWNILRLLDEARTLGPVTGKHWDTSSKVQV